MSRLKVVLAVALIALLGACGAGSSSTEAAPTAAVTVEPTLAAPTTPPVTVVATSTPPHLATPAAESTSTPTTEPVFCWHPEDRGRRLFGDLDGDGLVEVMFVDDGPDGTEVQICESATLSLEPINIGGRNKPANVHVVDIEGDGTNELLVGGPTGSTLFSGSPMRVIDGRWQPDHLTVTVRPALDGGGAEGESFVCIDVDGDGLSELLPLTYRVDGDRFVWQTPVDAGEIPLPDRAADAWIAASGTCRDVVTAPLGSNVVTELLRVVDTDAVPGPLASSDNEIGLGLHDEIIASRSGTELLEAPGWVLDVESYAQFSGPFSAIDVLHSAKRVRVLVGVQDHCAGPPLDTPDGISAQMVLSILPTGPSSCIDWFNVTLFLDNDLTVEAISLALFGP